MKKYHKEADLQADIIIYLEAHNYPAYNIIIASKDGVCDVVACIEGMFCSIEVKLDYNKPSELQAVKQSKVAMAGGYAIIAKSIEDVAKLIRLVRSDRDC